MALDQQPIAAFAMFAIVAQTHQHPAALQFFTSQREPQLTLAQSFGGLALGCPETTIPEHDGPATILTFRDGAFEVTIIEGMVLRFDGKTPGLGIERGTLGHRPGLENALHLKAQVKVKSPCRV